MREKLDTLVDQQRRRKLVCVFDWLKSNARSSYRKLMVMQTRGVAGPVLFQIFSTPQFHGIECFLWPTLYPTTAMCESVIQGQSNRASGKDSFIHKALSPAVDYSLNFELLQYQYDRWLLRPLSAL